MLNVKAKKKCLLYSMQEVIKMALNEDETAPPPPPPALVAK